MSRGDLRKWCLGFEVTRELWSFVMIIQFLDSTGTIPHADRFVLFVSYISWCLVRFVFLGNHNMRNIH